MCCVVVYSSVLCLSAAGFGGDLIKIENASVVLAPAYFSTNSPLRKNLMVG